MSILLDLRGGNGSALANKGILSTVCFVALTCLHSMWSAVFVAPNIIYSMHNVGGSRSSSGIRKQWTHGLGIVARISAALSGPAQALDRARMYPSRSSDDKVAAAVER